ncbi:alpha/beta fold hydrolase [Streptomyces sp. FH025]|uniref:alpha/beta fold hydrolase n=1 Tax=Streptomyces sp. FH025 TaxID=2815937 RepID=UPI001A9D4E1C|nr:alpha/beta hydrolase [Streptomyces sp. FH025]MBO1418588.1 alpha/beta hydrolase [Streptomyces sp. FH025]
MSKLGSLALVCADNPAAFLGTGPASHRSARKAQFDDPDPARREGLARIRARILAIAGGATSPVPQERIAELARRIPHCRLVTIEAGHLVHSARPREYVAGVAPFLKR